MSAGHRFLRETARAAARAEDASQFRAELAVLAERIFLARAFIVLERRGDEYAAVESRFDGEGHPPDPLLFATAFAAVEASRTWSCATIAGDRFGPLRYVANHVLVSIPFLKGEGLVEGGVVALIPAALARAEDMDDFAAACGFQRALAREESMAAVSAAIDPLTGIPNRGAFEQRFAEEWERAQRSGSSLALLMIDVDFFGAYNNRYGHPAGDDALRAVAAALAASISRFRDFVARYGGEEFAVLLPDADDAHAIELAEKMRRSVEERDVAHEATVLKCVTISTGVASLAPGDQPRRTLLDAADRMLLSAKHHGRNRVCGAGYESNAPRNARRFEARHNLPAEISAFIGRKREVDEVVSLCEGERLVTVTGLGGVGKTRVAIEAGHHLSERFADGATFVDLTAERHGTVVDAVASVLGIRGSAGSTTVDALLEKLQNSERLVLLDNCEHVADEAAQLVQSLLRSAANVRVLATAREPLGIPGERSYSLEPLEARDAAELFMARLTASGAAVPGEERDIERICDRLDRLPFAIELVAPRAAAAGTTAVLDVLRDRAFPLGAAVATRARRERTLENLLEWSYGLLDDDERVLYRRLSVFAGDWDDAAVAQACTPERTTDTVREQLHGLARRSLIVRTNEGRYRMLDLSARFAEERLRRDADEFDQSVRRHALYFARYGARLNAITREGRFREPARLFTSDLPNFERALDSLLAQQRDLVLGATLASDLARLWDVAGRVDRGEFWLSAAREFLNRFPPHVKGRVLMASCLLANLRADVRHMIEYGKLSMPLLAQSGDDYELASAYAGVGNGYLYDGRLDEAERMYASSLECAERAGNVPSIAAALVNLGNLAYEHHDDTAAARRLQRRAIDLLETIEPQKTMGIALLNLATMDSNAGEYGEAVTSAQRSATIFAATGSPMIALAHVEAANARRHLGDFSGARRALTQATDVFRDFNNPRFAATCMEQWGGLAAAIGQDEMAARCFGFVESFRATHGISLSRHDRARTEHLRHATRSTLGDRYGAAASEGAHWTFDEAFSAALSM